DNAQQFFCRDVGGEQEVADERLLGFASAQSAARRNPPQSRQPGKVLFQTKALVADDGGSAPFATVVRGGLELLDGAKRPLSCKTPLDCGIQFALVSLERQEVIAAALQHRSGNRTAAKKRVASDKTVLEPQHLEYGKRGFHFVALGRLARGQCHASLSRKGADQLHG